MEPEDLRCYIISGPNGAGKTTFAENYLPVEAECLNFLNADLIAKGIAPFNPESAALTAGKIFLNRIEAMAASKVPFAFETTLSGLNFINRINQWQSLGYKVILYFLYLPAGELAVKRVKLRVSQGGHHIPEDVIIRRYNRGWENFRKHYKHVVDDWTVFDNSGDTPLAIERKK